MKDNVDYDLRTTQNENDKEGRNGRYAITTSQGKRTKITEPGHTPKTINRRTRVSRKPNKKKHPTSKSH